MSFILDALKKSEAERQRQTGPTLLELRVTHPRRRYPIWALVIGGLLAVNALVLLFVALHRPAAPGGTASAAAGAAGPAPLAPATAPRPAALSGAPLSAAATPATVTVPPGAPSAATPVAAVSQIAAGTPQAAAVGSVAPLAGAAQSAAASAAPAHNPADDAPAVSGATAPLGRADYAALPSAASLGDDVPALQLNMLVSSSRAADRYALINMHRVHEGDVLPEGARVLAITPDGVAMEYHGQDFLLPRAAASPPPAQ